MQKSLAHKNETLLENVCCFVAVFLSVFCRCRHYPRNSTEPVENWEWTSYLCRYILATTRIKIITRLSLYLTKLFLFEVHTIPPQKRRIDYQWLSISLALSSSIFTWLQHLWASCGPSRSSSPPVLINSSQVRVKSYTTYYVHLHSFSLEKKNIKFFFIPKLNLRKKGKKSEMDDHEPSPDNKNVTYL